MRSISQAALAAALAACSVAAQAGISARQEGTQVLVRGNHFRLAVDRARGGEITQLSLLDGKRWNGVLGGDGQTCPQLSLSDGQARYALASDRSARLQGMDASPGKVQFAVKGAPCARDGNRSPWAVTLSYEIYAEGAVFIDLDCRLEEGEFPLAASEVAFPIDRALTQSPKYRSGSKRGKACFPSARVAFGTNPQKSFTNELEVMVEYRRPMAGQVGFQQKAGVFRWTLGGGGGRLRAPFRYHNRMSIGLGAAATGTPRTNVVGQRVHHWVNWLDKAHWYPTREQIDRMVANHGTMLILHHEWMKQRGSNGNPHADYAVVRNHDDMVESIAHAHRKGLRVGLYMRGVEPYALNARFFEKYCTRNRDGIYVDWHGPLAAAYHDNRYKPNPTFGDRHFSPDGHYLPGKEYFLFTRRLRQIVGPRGFLIGHMGPFNSGILANLVFDAYLPGETGSDHLMLADRDEAVFKGMMGGVTCMPWALDAPKYRTPEGVAKMAAWGLYPHLVLGIRRGKKGSPLFTRDPDGPEYRFVLPYWRVLAAIDVERATALNLPSHNVVAAVSSSPFVHCIVYKEADRGYLVVAANLGDQPTTATITPSPKALGLSGEYTLARIDSRTGKPAPCGTTTGTLTTTLLPPWGIEGYLLRKGTGKAQ